MMGIPVLDHIIFGKDNYYSFYEHMNNNWYYMFYIL
jgi:DNA repair protein RadC